MSIWVILLLVGVFIFVVWLARTQFQPATGRLIIIFSGIVLIILVLYGIGVFDGVIGSGHTIRVR